MDHIQEDLESLRLLILGTELLGVLEEHLRAFITPDDTDVAISVAFEEYLDTLEGPPSEIKAPAMREGCSFGRRPRVEPLLDCDRGVVALLVAFFGYTLRRLLLMEPPIEEVVQIAMVGEGVVIESFR